MRFRTGLAILMLSSVLWPQDVFAQGNGNPNIRFEGNSVFTRSELLSAIRFYDVDLSGNFEITAADDAAYFLRLFYFEQGFPGAEVRYQFEATPSRVTFDIDEGTRKFIRNLSFEGGDAISPEQLEAIVTSAIRTETRQPFGRLRFVEGAIEQALDSIAGRYRGQGYLNVVTSFEAQPVTEGQVDVVVTIDQGPQYRIRSVELTPMDVLEETGLDKNINLPTGRVYRPGREVAVRTSVIDALNNVGYRRATAQVDVQIDKSSHMADIVITMEPGERVRIASIEIEGSPRTSRRALRQWLTIAPGEVYDASRVNETVSRMWFSGAFSEVSTKVEEVSDGEVQLTINLEDGKSKRITTAVGYGTWEQFYGRFDYTDFNFLGTLNRFQAGLYGSARSYAAYLDLANRFFLGSDWTAGVRALGTRRWVPAYRSTITSASARLTLQPDDVRLTGIEFQYVWRAVFDSEVFGLEDEESFLEDYQVGLFSLQTTLDRRNDALAPMSGYLLDNTVALASPAFLGDLSFFRIDSQATYYLPFGEITKERPWVPFLALNTRVGLILPFADTDLVPTQERFFLGGETSVRSFQYDGLGPRDGDGDPLGGQAYFLYNVEFQMPVFNALYAVVFTDIGNLAVEVQDLSLDQTAVAVGGGLRFYTPVGALRIDYGYNLNRLEGDPIGAWNFGFGFTF